jgi:hypothetical protein
MRLFTPLRWRTERPQWVVCRQAVCAAESGNGGYRRTPGYKLLEYVCEDNREYVDESGMTRLRIGGPE